MTQATPAVLTKAKTMVSCSKTTLSRCSGGARSAMTRLIVEYDTAQSNRWVPYPLSRTVLSTLFKDAGYSSMAFLGSRPSRYQRSGMYSALVEG